MRLEPPIDPALIAEHNRGVWQARAVYYSQPISSPSYACKRCTGHGYEPRELCGDCDKEDRAKAAREARERYWAKKEGAA